MKSKYKTDAVNKYAIGKNHQSTRTEVSTYSPPSDGGRATRSHCTTTFVFVKAQHGHLVEFLARDDRPIAPHRQELGIRPVARPREDATCERIFDCEDRLAGRSLGARAWPPYEWAIPRRIAKSQTGGPLQLEIKITSTLLPFVEGQQWDQRGHCTVDA